MGKYELWETFILFVGGFNGFYGNGLIVGGFNGFYGNRLIVGEFNPNCGKIQSGASSLAKQGGAYFSAVCGSIQDPIAAPGPHETQEP